MEWKMRKKRRKRVTNYISVLEGLLFVAGDDGITLEEASYILELERSAVRQLLDELKKRLEDENSGLELLLTASHYKLVTKASLKSYIENMRFLHILLNCLKLL